MIALMMTRYLIPFLTTALLQSSILMAAQNLPHLDLEMTSDEYRSLVDTELKKRKFFALSDLSPILEYGKRNLDWIALINRNRSPEKKLQLSTPTLQPAYPIDHPSASNPTLIEKKFADAQAQMPASMANVIFKNAELTPSTPAGLDDETFLSSARLLDHAYQMASRWLLEEPYLDAYTERAYRDVRGYYYLNLEEGLADKLQGWSKLDASAQARLKPWLITICVNNTRNAADCETEFTSSAKADKVSELLAHYFSAAKDNYDSFFNIQNVRTDSVWNETARTFTVPFLIPVLDEVKTWAKFNIEDEWRLPSWNLQLSFETSGDHPHIAFQPGATPHVNGLGGNEITMDSNRDLNEYSSSWTIRHEFGHTLGFPDCYFEFYDSSSQTMVQYQLDTTNLMCSRRGHFQVRHYDELKKNYAH